MWLTLKVRRGSTHHIDLIDPFDSSINQGAQFLAEYFHEEVIYSVVNVCYTIILNQI